MLRIHRLTVVAISLALLTLAGCPKSRPAAKDADAKATDKAVPAHDGHDHDHDHSHDGGKMLIADCGKYHAKLTAHLSSKEGNALEILFATADRADKPVAFPMESFSAQIKVGSGDFQEVKFEPSSERPKGEAMGSCSHFVARTPWLKPDATLYLAARVRTPGGGEATAEWKNFSPKKYAHHED